MFNFFSFVFSIKYIKSVASLRTVASVIIILVVVMYPYQQKRKFFLLDHLMSHKFKEVTYFLELTVRLNTKCSFFWKQILIYQPMSVVGNFLLILSVVSNIFRPLSLVG